MRDAVRWLRHNLIWFLGLLVVIGGGAAYAYTSYQQRTATERLGQVIECQARYNEAVDRALAERRQATDAERDALTITNRAQRDALRAQAELITAVLEGDLLSPEERVDTFQRFRERVAAADQALEASERARAEADATRADNPLPTNRC